MAILLLADAISSAFRLVLYHPVIAVAFASVLQDYLILPTAFIFGAKNSPSLYMIPEDVRLTLQPYLRR
jgi:hypothetical protein